MGMGSNFFLAYVIALLCAGIALAALGFLICGIFLWRKKRWLSLVFIIPSALYLALFLYIFIPRPLPHRILTIDLRKPTDLSGFPPGTKWFLAHWPPPKTVVPLSPDGGSTDVAGRVGFSITLPDGQMLQDVGREVYIDSDDAGIWRIEIWTADLLPEKALQNLKPSLWPIALSSKNKGGIPEELTDMENHLRTYVPKAPLYFDFRLAFPSYEFYFHVMPTFTPSEKVRYLYLIELPHVPWFERFTALPAVSQPEKLLQDCRQILNLGAIRTIPKEQWQSSISHLNPSTVYVNNGNVLLIFDSHAETGSHGYAISLGDQPASDPQVHVLSTPYPGINEVGVHK